MTISVIVPTLNEAKRIGTLLENLTGIPDTEIIVSDGGSEDATVEICRRFPVTVVSSPKGRGGQLNAGAAGATGDVFLFLHADSSMEARVAEDIRTAVKAGRHWGCCTLAFDDSAPFFRVVAAASNWRARFLSSCFGDQGIYCTRELFREAGGFAAIPLMEDVDFSQRLRLRQKARVIPGRVITSARRFKEEGALQTILKMQALKALYALEADPCDLARRYRSGAGDGR